MYGRVGGRSGGTNRGRGGQGRVGYRHLLSCPVCTQKVTQIKLPARQSKHLTRNRWRKSPSYTHRWTELTSPGEPGRPRRGGGGPTPSRFPTSEKAPEGLYLHKEGVFSTINYKIIPKNSLFIGINIRPTRLVKNEGKLRYVSPFRSKKPHSENVTRHPILRKGKDQAKRTIVRVCLCVCVAR